MKAFYEVISGPAGQPRQWSRDRTLYIPDIRFVAMSEDKDGKARAHDRHSSAIRRLADRMMVKEGFYESEIQPRDAEFRPHRPRLQHLRDTR